MSRRCELSGVGPQFGNNVSHSNRRTRRCFDPNLRNVEYFSDCTGEKYSLRVLAKTMRSIEKAGGFDSFMAKSKDCTMSNKAKKIRRRIIEKQGVAA